MGISVIISHYKKVENLRLILSALTHQSFKEFEVIVSEDGSDTNTKILLKQLKADFPLLHLTQEDKGFRKNKILNTSVQKASGELLVFIDGDCIPHRHFVQAYHRKRNLDAILYGRRVFLSKALSEKFLRKQSFQSIGFLELLFSGSKKLKEHIYTGGAQLSLSKNRGLKGCNWGILKKHILAINGFDEDYVHPTVGEDDDIYWRLAQAGLPMVSMKNQAIVYHLHHPRTYSEKETSINTKLIRAKMEAAHTFCKNGISKVTS